MDQAPKLGEGGGEAGGVGLLERDVQLVPCTKDAGVSPAGRGFGTLDWSEMVAGSRTELDTVQRQPAPTNTPTSPAGASRQMADPNWPIRIQLADPWRQSWQRAHLCSKVHWSSARALLLSHLASVPLPVHTLGLA